MMDRFYTPLEASKIFKVSARTILRLIESGQLRALDMSAKGSKRKTWRIHESEVLRFTAEGLERFKV